ncbi:MFS transporter [Sphaerisporangium fuscum]|uniref:MFS transporter n=1 Tax=Sphaerisporangium fuscum TaxID=2835868 RepID=UPI001BDCC228|nr:MFS transporter [Sphaerisporangium fuscum]
MSSTPQRLQPPHDSAAPDPFEALTPVHRRLLTVAALGCAFLGMLDGTVVGTAMPRVVAQLGGGQAWYAWTVTAYLLTSTVTVPLYGRFSDLWGRRTPLLAGLAIFLAGSLACGLAGSMGALITFRAAQGVGAGALLTVGMAVVRDLYPPHRMSGMVRMQTVLAGVMVAGMVGGPLVGGVLTDHAGWRWVFLLNVPVGALAAAAIAALLPRHRPYGDGERGLDLAGIGLLTGGLSLVLLGLSLKGYDAGAGSPSWGSPAVAVPLAAGLVLLALLVPVERRARVPVLPLHLLARRTYAAVVAAGFFFQVANLPAMVFLPLYFQQVRGYGATASGLLLLPAMVGMAGGNRLTAAVITRTGRARPALLAGAALLTAGTVLFVLLGATTPPAVTAVLLALVGLSLGPAMGGASIVAQYSVPRADVGMAVAGSALTKQIGASVGLACGQSLLAQLLAPAGSGTADSAAAIGTTIAWIGGTGGLLAVAAVLLMRDLPLLAGDRPPADGTPDRQK